MNARQALYHGATVLLFFNFDFLGNDLAMGHKPL
jgi:hypothetical protein